MLSRFQKLLLYFWIIAFFYSHSGIFLSLHYCHDELYDFSFFEKVGCCCSSEEVNFASYPVLTETEDSCCSDHMVIAFTDHPFFSGSGNMLYLLALVLSVLSLVFHTFSVLKEIFELKGYKQKIFPFRFPYFFLSLKIVRTVVFRN